MHAYIHTYMLGEKLRSDWKSIEECKDIQTYIHAYIHTYTHTYIHTYIHTYMPGEKLRSDWKSSEQSKDQAVKECRQHEKRAQEIEQSLNTAHRCACMCVCVCMYVGRYVCR